MGNLQKIKDFELFCANFVKIRGFDGKLIPFIWNRGQRRLWETIKDDLRIKGYSKIVMVKARKGGFTTFFSVLAFWLALTNTGTHNLIGVHRKDLQNTVMDMINVVHDNLPQDTFQVTLGRDQAAEKTFSNLNSGVKTVVMSKTSKVGRGDTPRLIVISEIAHIERAHLLEGSVLNSNKMVKGAITALETTANGVGNYHHRTYVMAKANKNNWTPFFSPWHENDRYRLPAPPSFTPDEDEIKLMRRHGLDIDQVYWRHEELKDTDPDMFKQEFPITDDEAFAFSGYECYIPIEDVNDAFDRPLYASFGQRIAGYDPAPTPTGDDKAYVERQRKNVDCLDYPKLRTQVDEENYLALKLKEKDHTGKYRIDKLYIDFGGGGKGIYDHLIDKGFSNKRVFVVNSSKRADDPNAYKNKRAEMTARIKDALQDKDYPLAINVGDRHKEQFKSELSSEGAKLVDGLLLIEKKDDVKLRLGFSPGGKDGLGLTYADIEADINMSDETYLSMANNTTAMVDEEVYSL